MDTYERHKREHEPCGSFSTWTFIPTEHGIRTRLRCQGCSGTTDFSQAELAEVRLADRNGRPSDGMAIAWRTIIGEGYAEAIFTASQKLRRAGAPLGTVELFDRELRVQLDQIAELMASSSETIG
jgi:hypothetical protein